MRKVFAVILSVVIVLTVGNVVAFAAGRDEDIVLRLQDGNFKVYREVSSASRQAQSVAHKAQEPVKEVSRQAKSVSQKAGSVSRKAKSVSRKAAEPVRKVSRVAKSQKRRVSSVSRNAEKLYSDVMKSRRLMENSTPEPVPISQANYTELETAAFAPETEEFSEEKSEKRSMGKYVPVILAAVFAVAGAVLLVRKKLEDRKEEGEYKSFQ